MTNLTKKRAARRRRKKSKKTIDDPKTIKAIRRGLFGETETVEKTSLPTSFQRLCEIRQLAVTGEKHPLKTLRAIARLCSKPVIVE